MKLCPITWSNLLALYRLRLIFHNCFIPGLSAILRPGLRNYSASHGICDEKNPESFQKQCSASTYEITLTMKRTSLCTPHRNVHCMYMYTCSAIMLIGCLLALLALTLNLKSGFQYCRVTRQRYYKKVQNEILRNAKFYSMKHNSLLYNICSEFIWLNKAKPDLFRSLGTDFQPVISKKKVSVHSRVCRRNDVLMKHDVPGLFPPEQIESKCRSKKNCMQVIYLLKCEKDVFDAVNTEKYKLCNRNYMRRYVLQW